jgi:hypothetical protein
MSMQILSKVLTFAIVMASVAAPAAAQVAGPASDLQRLVNDLGVQLVLRYRATLPEYQLRYDQLGQTIAAWNASPKTAAERAQIASWLQDAIRSAMPGSTVAWPAVPQLGGSQAVEAAAPPIDAVRNKPVVPDRPEVVTKQAPAEPAQAEPAQQEAAQAEPQSAQPEVDQPPTPKPPVDDSNAAQAPATTQPSEGTTPWLDHPAAGDLPADLKLGDPFKDDPLPAAGPPALPDSP